MQHNSRTGPNIPSPVTDGKPSPSPSGLMAEAKRRVRIARGIKQLKGLSDEALYDLGLSRGDIEFAARYGRQRSHKPACSTDHGSVRNKNFTSQKQTTRSMFSGDHGSTNSLPSLPTVRNVI